jgi:hypothetical protein
MRPESVVRQRENKARAESREQRAESREQSVGVDQPLRPSELVYHLNATFGDLPTWHSSTNILHSCGFVILISDIMRVSA